MEFRLKKWPRWNYPFPFPNKQTKIMNLFMGYDGQYAIPDGGVSHQIASCINRGDDHPEKRTKIPEFLCIL